MELFKKVLRLETADGDFIEVRTPSVWAAEEIKARINELTKILKKPKYKEMTFGQAYRDDRKFRTIVNKALRAAGIDPQVLSLDMMLQLLYPHHEMDEEGELVLREQGALVDFIWGPPQHGESLDGMKVNDLDAMAKLVGEMWAATEDFDEVIRVLNTLSHEDLSEIMKHRNFAKMSPEDRHKKQQQDASKKLAEKVYKKKHEDKSDDKGVELTEAETDVLMNRLM